MNLTKRSLSFLHEVVLFCSSFCCKKDESPITANFIDGSLDESKIFYVDRPRESTKKLKVPNLSHCYKILL